jgi:hypothetical protein
MNRSVFATALVGLLVPAALAGGPLQAATAAPAPTTVPRAAPDGDEDVGRWSVSEAGTDTWTVAWSSPDRLPLAADRPAIVAAEDLGEIPAGTELGVPTVAEDGRTVEVTVTSTTEPATESLDVVLSGEQLDEAAAPSPAPPAPRWSEPVRTLLGADPGLPGDLPVVTSDYELDGIQVPGMAEDVEMVGHVVEPEAADPSAPLVLLMHGRHSFCYNPETGRQGWRWPCAGAQVPIPSHLGYDYVQRLLASQGYVTVSIAANGINAQDGDSPDGGADARSRLVQAHLDLWASSWAADHGHQADLDKVVLVGHSRGGEGVSRASLEIPLSAPYRVVGQVLIGPTNFGRQTTPYVPTVTMLPSCDGDVIDLQGQAYTDLARDLATGDTALKSSLMVVGANHNFFNTQWTPSLADAPAWDDWGSRDGVCGRGADTRLTAGEQRRVGKAYVAGAVALFAEDDETYLPMYDGSAVRVESTGDAVVLSHMIGGDQDIRVPGAEGSLTSPVGATTVLCEGVTPWGRTPDPLCGRFTKSPENTPHWPTDGSLVPTHDALQMTWRASGGAGGLDLAEPLDLRTADRLDLRTIVDPGLGDVAVQVRLTDENGASVVVDPVAGNLLPALPAEDGGAGGKYWAQTLRVDTADVTGIDEARVTRVELIGMSDQGRLWVLDLAATEDASPAVPARRVPIVDLGKVRVDEGGAGAHLAEVPFTVTGTVTEPAQLRVYGFTGFSDGEEAPPVLLDVALAPGSGDGTFGWEYTGDDLDSYPRSFHELVGHAISDVMVRDSQGRVVVVDDDPAPSLSFSAVRPRAAEGGFAQLVVTLSEPSGYEVGVGMHVERGPGTPARAHDVGVTWLKKWTRWRPGTDPVLHDLQVGQFGWAVPGETTLVFQVPIRDDGRSEGRETLTLRATTEDGWRSDPVTVVIPPSD